MIKGLYDFFHLNCIFNLYGGGRNVGCENVIGDAFKKFLQKFLNILP